MNRTYVKLHLTLAALVAFSSAALAGGKPLEAKVEAPYDPLVDQAGDPVSDPNAPLYAANCVALLGQSANPPLIAPDGHPITAAEWTQASGRATAQCTPKGTHITLHVSGLIPGGVYTAWLITFASPGFDWPWTYAVGVGALGAQDGSQNVLHVSASGEAQLSVFQPATQLSMFGEVTNCLFDEFQFQVALVYHLDFRTYGGMPAADECLIAAPIGFTFTPH